VSGGQASAANGDRAYAGAAASRYGHYTTGAWNGDLAHIGAAPPDTEPPEPLPEPPPVPEVTGVSPDHGSTDGGEHADVYGAGFAPGGVTTVTFAGAAAASVAVVSDNHLTCLTPPGAAGPADVAVTAPGGEAALPGGFTYEAPAAPAKITAAFSYTPPEPATQDNVTFDASASTPGEGETITTYAWLFNNSVTRSGVTCSWRLPSGHGDYDAQLTVTDSGGNSDVLTEVITI
jgi:hypothetical protein